MIRLIGYFFGIGTTLALLVAAGVAIYISHLAKDLPDYVLVQYAFPFGSGPKFADYLMTNGGPARVNAAFQHPPTATEQIIHPEKFVAGARAKKVFDFGPYIPDPLYGMSDLMEVMTLGLYRSRSFRDYLDLYMAVEHARVHQALMEGAVYDVDEIVRLLAAGKQAAV